MADTKITPQGYLYGGAPSASHPFWDETAQIVDYIKSVGGTEETTDEGTTYTISQTNSNDVIQEVIKILVPKASTATAGVQSVSLTEETTATGKDYTISQTTEEGTAEVGVISVPDPVEPGVQEAVKSLRVEETKGTDKDTYAFYATDQDGVETEIITVNVPTVYVKNITITNENGIYSIVTTDQTGTETTSTIEVPEVDTSNVLAEISDAVVENETDGYDFHTLTETEYNGTKNEVGKFYIAREQVITGADTTYGGEYQTTRASIPIVDQEGNESTFPIIVSKDVTATSYFGIGRGSSYPFRGSFVSSSSSGYTRITSNSGGDQIYGYYYLDLPQGNIFNTSQDSHSYYFFRLTRFNLPEATLTSITDTTSLVRLTLTHEYGTITLYGNTYIEGGSRKIFVPAQILPYAFTSATTGYWDCSMYGGEIDFSSASNTLLMLTIGHSVAADTITALEVTGLN